MLILESSFCNRCRADTPHYKDGRCRPCRSVESKKRRERHPEKIQAAKEKWRRERPDLVKAQIRKWAQEHPQAMRAHARKYATGWSGEMFDMAWVAQGGCCAICRRPMQPTGHKKDSVTADHCHATGQTRGLLCNKCNTGIGYFDDDPVRLQSARDYVEFYRQPERKRA
jgi:Recombination endonuclease VII